MILLWNFIRYITVHFNSFAFLQFATNCNPSAKRSSHAAKWGLYFTIRSLHIAKKSLHTAKRSLHIAKRSLHTAKRSSYTAMKSSYAAKRSSHTAKWFSHAAKRFLHQPINISPISILALQAQRIGLLSSAIFLFNFFNTIKSI